MSSTNRGAKRVKNDFYETPSWFEEIVNRLAFGQRQYGGPVMLLLAMRGMVEAMR